MGKKYYRSQEETILGQSVRLETWHEDNGWFSTRRHSKITHFATGMTWEETSDDTFHESDAKAKNSASIWISNWLRKQQEEEKRRQEEERKRIEAVKRAEREAYEQRLRQQQEENARRQREQEAAMQRQRDEHARQLRESQRVSLTALKNEKSAERQRIINYELSVVERKIAEIDEQIEHEEKELHKFATERNVEGHQTIVMVGMTSGGKSTLGNRLCGDVSMMANSGPFKASNDNKSCTQLLQKYIHNKLSVIDCPGWADSGHKDRTHTNNLCTYLRGCGGINAFVVVRKGSDRFDAFFQDQLKYMHSMFGDAFWNHLVVVLTRIDKGIAEMQFKQSNKAQQFKDDIATLCNGVNGNVAVVPIGLDNYTDALPQLLTAIPSTKFECDQIISPIDERKAQKTAFMNEKAQIQQRVNAIGTEISSIDAQITNLN